MAARKKATTTTVSAVAKLEAELASLKAQLEKARSGQEAEAKKEADKLSKDAAEKMRQEALKREQEKAKQLAEQLDISNAAVTDMMKKLSRDGLVNYKRYKGIKLTGQGESYAKNMVRRHRIWELFLQRIVGMPWDKVHDEAENLEHSSSDELVNRLEVMLDYPQFDPHGDL